LLDTAVVWVLFLIPARLGEKSGDRGEVKGCNSVVWVLFLIPAGWGRAAEGVRRVCGGCEMVPYCDVGIIFNTRKVVGGFVWCALDGGGINGANSSRGRKGENGRRNKQILLDVLVLCSRAQKTLPLSNRFQ
jgi:hypothetical protein